MTPRHAAALALVGWYVLTSPLSWAQSHTGALKTFTAPDGAFTFCYSDPLIHCEKNQQGDWTPDICFGYVCDDVVQKAEGDLKSVGCFAYPRDKFTNTPAFQGATFSVEVVDGSATEKGCPAAKIPDVFDERVGTTTIHGVSFEVLSYSTVGAGSGIDGRIYRAFHRGKCYQLGISRGYTNVVDFDPPVRELNEADDREVDSRLDQALKSFRFLK